MYQVRKEELRGPFGVLKKKTALGELSNNLNQEQLGLASGIQLSLTEHGLLIESTGSGSYRVDF